MIFIHIIYSDFKKETLMNSEDILTVFKSPLKFIHQWFPGGTAGGVLSFLLPAPGSERGRSRNYAPCIYIIKVVNSTPINDHHGAEFPVVLRPTKIKQGLYCNSHISTLTTHIISSCRAGSALYIKGCA